MGGTTGSFLKDSAYAFAARVWMVLTRGLALIAISRTLGPEHFGTYSLVLNTYVLTVMIGTLGLEQANTYYAGKEPRSIPTLVINAAWTSFVLGLAAVSVMVIVVRICRGWLLDEQSTRLIHECMLFVPIAILSAQLSGIVAGCAWFRYYAWTEIFKWALYVAFAVALIVSHRLTARSGLLAFYLAVCAMATVHAVRLSRRFRPSRTPIAGCLKLARESFSYGRKVFGINALNLLNFRFDLYLVKYFRSASEVGIYSLGMNLTEVLLYCGRSVSLVLFSRVAAAEQASERLTSFVTRSLNVAMLGLAFVVLVCKDPLISRVFGEKYLLSSNIVTLLLPGIMGQSLALLVIADLLGKNCLSPVLRSGVICFIVMVLLDLYCIPKWGALGAAVVSTIAYLSQCAYLLWYHSVTSGRGIEGYILLGRGDLGVLLSRLRTLRGSPA